MNNTNKSLDQILTLKGFKHASGGQPPDPAHSDCLEYLQGYRDGRRTLDNYEDKIIQRDLRNELEDKHKTRHGES